MKKLHFTDNFMNKFWGGIKEISRNFIFNPIGKQYLTSTAI